jgi:hypothetical protein
MFSAAGLMRNLRMNPYLGGPWSSPVSRQGTALPAEWLQPRGNRAPSILTPLTRPTRAGNLGLPERKLPSERCCAGFACTVRTSFKDGPSLLHELEALREVVGSRAGALDNRSRVPRCLVLHEQTQVAVTEA